MAARLDGLALPAIDLSAIGATPCEAGQGQHFFLKGVVSGHGYFPGTIHVRHLAHEVQAVIGLPFQDIELPLVDHLMGEGIQQFLFCVGRSFREPLQQRERQSNFSAVAD